MKWIATITHPRLLNFMIEPEEYRNLSDGTSHTEYKLYVYEDGKDKYDFLQNSLEIAMDQAFEDFGVPKNAWKQIE